MIQNKVNYQVIHFIISQYYGNKNIRPTKSFSLILGKATIPTYYVNATIIVYCFSYIDLGITNDDNLYFKNIIVCVVLNPIIILIVQFITLLQIM